MQCGTVLQSFFIWWSRYLKVTKITSDINTILILTQYSTLQIKRCSWMRKKKGVTLFYLYVHLFPLSLLKEHFPRELQVL